MSCACACKSQTKSQTLTDEQKQILEAMANIQAPCGAKEIAEATGIDAKAVSSRITDMKKQGLVDSPVRCKYGITAEGRSAIKC